MNITDHMTYLSIDELYHHPHNPRMDLGDLTELSESIRACGVMQNLTVIEGHYISDGTYDPNGYTVVIGNRRMEASKIAGLDELPCMIAEMSEEEQLSTMLLENMQRSDLSLQEQAHGFQMMMDLGVTADDIAEKTGLSKTTVNRRIKLCQFNPDDFNAGCERGATLMDWMEIDKIEDLERKEKLISVVGTSNFSWELKRAIDGEKIEKWLAKTIAQVTPWATDISKKENIWRDYTRIASYSSLDKVTTVDIPDDIENREYFFKSFSYGMVALYTKKEKDADSEVEPDPEEIERERLLIEKRDEITRRAFELRQDFVIKYQGAKKHQGYILEYLINLIIEQADFISYDIDNMCSLLGIEPPDDDEAIAGAISSIPVEKIIVTWMVTGGLIADHEETGYFSWDGSYKCNNKLNLLYQLLEKLGYEVSDEERQLQSGTHELFLVKDKSDEHDE